MTLFVLAGCGVDDRTLTANPDDVADAAGDATRSGEAGAPSDVRSDRSDQNAGGGDGRVTVDAATGGDVTTGNEAGARDAAIADTVADTLVPPVDVRVDGSRDAGPDVADDAGRDADAAIVRDADAARDADASQDADAPRVTITVLTTVAGGQFGKAYASTLSATGGTAPYRWSLNAGSSLPAGLTLAASGALQGTPTSDGAFTFGVTVTDASGNTATAQLSMAISRQRWLIYTSDETSAGQVLLYAIDTSSSLLAKTTITASLPAGASAADLFQFSPDGKWLTYYVVNGAAYALYVLDLSGTALGTPIRVGTGNNVAATWSPSSKTLLYAESTAAGAGYFYADFTATGPGPSLPVAIPANAGGPVWVGDNVLMMPVSGQVSYIRRGANGFSAPQQFAASGEPRAFRHDLERAWLVSQQMGPCFAPSYVVDFRAPSLTTLNNADVSPDLAWVARPNAQTFTSSDLVRFADLPAGAPVGTIPSQICDAVAWAHGGSALLWAGSTTDPRVRRSVITGNTLTSQTILGAYNGIGNNMAFSPDDQWVTFLADEGLFLAPVGAAMTATRIAPVNYDVVISPDSKALTYSTLDAADNRSFFLVDFRTGTPAPARPINFNAYGNGGSVGWSADGSRFAYVAKRLLQPSGTIIGLGLYIVNPLDEADQGTRLSASPVCGTICPGLKYAAFQP